MRKYTIETQIRKQKLCVYNCTCADTHEAGE